MCAQENILLKQLNRERKARKEAEAIAEKKCRVLYEINGKLAVRHEITRILAEGVSLDEVSHKIIKIMCETLQLPYGGLWKVDQVNNVLRCVDIWNCGGDAIEKFGVISKQFTLSFGVGLPGRVWQNKSVYWIEDVTIDSNFPRAKWAIEANFHSGFGLPIFFEGEILGVFEFFMSSLVSIDENMMNMLNDIANQIGIFIGREYAQKRVTSLSRLAGMAEVASSVLHNVGNALNSINTSVEMLGEKIKLSKMEILKSLTELLQQHKKDFATFLTKDTKGKHVPELISELSKTWEKDKKYFLEEINALRKNVNHVKNIITTQQSLSTTLGLREEVSIGELLEDGLTLNKSLYERSNIQVLYDFSPIQKAILDRAKLLQIIVNLIKNSIDALEESEIEPKQLLLKLQEKDDKHFMIQVGDNGVGVLRENLTKIFSHGFTTKNDGHGFGLHASALFAQEMGGKLFAESKGIGKGATFTLILPYQAVSKGKDKNE